MSKKKKGKRKYKVWKETGITVSIFSWYVCLHKKYQKKPTKQLLEVRSKFPRWQDIRSIYWINCILYNDRRKLENKILNTIPLKPAAISASESNKTWINHNPTKILFFFFWWKLTIWFQTVHGNAKEMVYPKQYWKKNKENKLCDYNTWLQDSQNYSNQDRMLMA